MRLLIYSHFFAPSVGGVETIVLSLAHGLAELRTLGGAPEFEVTLVTQTPAGDFADHSLPFRVVRRPSMLALWRLVRAADIIHLAGPALAPMFFSWIARKPFVIEHHGYQAICPNGQLIHQPDISMCPGHFQARRYWKCLSCQAAERSWFRALASLLLMFPRNSLSRRARKNIAVSWHALRRNGLPRSIVIYHGVENKAPERQPDSSESSPIVFAYVGRLVSEKGIPVLIEATKKLIKEGYSFAVQLIGDGPERPRLEQLVRRAALEHAVRFTGCLTGFVLSNALTNVHALIMPSQWEETAGLAAIEHMRRGGLVIASDTGGLAEVVGDAGLRFPPADPAALADCMRTALRHPHFVKSLGRAARERSLLLFERSRMLEQHAAEYRRAP